METGKTVVFSVEQVNAILGSLGKIPAEYSFELIQFIREVALPQVSEEPTSDVADVVES